MLHNIANMNSVSSAAHKSDVFFTAAFTNRRMKTSSVFVTNTHARVEQMPLNSLHLYGDYERYRINLIKVLCLHQVKFNHNTANTQYTLMRVQENVVEKHYCSRKYALSVYKIMVLVRKNHFR